MTDLKNRLSNYQEEINTAIDQYLPKQNSMPPIIHEAMRYSALSKGKRIRPILALETVNMFSNEYKKAMPAAVAIELAHCFTLVHDDLPSIDDDDLRRGVLTNHKVYGDGMALLAGDALLIDAFRVISDFQKPLEVVPTVISLLSNALSSNGVIGGQVVDILAEKNSLKHDYENLKYLHLNKTAKLIQASVLIGAEISQVERSKINILKDASEKIGIAFQIKDDLLDVLGDVNKIGKNIGRDEELGKLTYPKVFGITQAKKMSDNLKFESIDLLKQIDNSDKLIEIFEFLVDRNF
jgi:geranylgeranyl diphosphate synthase type II